MIETADQPDATAPRESDDPPTYHLGASPTDCATATEPLAQADSCTSDAGERAGPATSCVSAALSPREREVLQLIARGYTHDQTANRLNISTHTVNTYVKRIRSKLGVGNKAELTTAAGLLPGSQLS